MNLPSFLDLLDGENIGKEYFNAASKAGPPLEPSHAIWWPPKAGGTPETVVHFVPGNPGLVGLYIPFLSEIYKSFDSDCLAVLAHSHLGHTGGVGQASFTDNGLTLQVQNGIEYFDALKREYPDCRVVILGHSVGAWISLQILKARPNAVSGLFLLFPTISHIGKTPNGRFLSWAFRPTARRIIAWAACLTKTIPTGLVSSIMRSWPYSQIVVLHDFVKHPRSVYAALKMANDEMWNIQDLDVDLLHTFGNRIWFYFAGKDDWVGDERETILSNLHPNTERVFRGENIPHAFCINHGEIVAMQCVSWLRSMA